jgi:hypothetical protein
MKIKFLLSNIPGWSIHAFSEEGFGIQAKVRSDASHQKSVEALSS